MYKVMPTLPTGRVIGAASGVRPPAPNVRAYAQVNTSRKGRHEAREWRRNGYWDDYLAFPQALLWLDEVCAASALDAGQELECDASAITDLWP